MKNVWWLLLAMLGGCSPAPDGDIDEAAFGAAPVVLDRPVLRLLNERDPDSLRALGVSAAAVFRIGAVRRGPDGDLGTSDDGTFHTATEVGALRLARADVNELLAAAHRSPPVDSACLATSPRSAAGKLVVTPDEGDAPFVAAVDQARETVDVVMYELSAPSMRAALARASRRGVHVRVIADRTRRGTSALLAELNAAGVAAKASSDRFAFTHQKTMVVDGKTLFVFSGNFDVASFTHGRNFAVVLNDPEDIWDAEDLFSADWDDRDVVLACTRLVVAPINATSRVVALIESATESIAVEALYASDPAVTGALIAAKKRGVDVRVLFNDPKFNVGDATVTAQSFARHGIAVRRSPNLFIHAKLIVVDGEAAFVGSENFSTNSLEHNREVGVIVNSAASAPIDIGAILAVFDSDYSRGVPFGL